jgi:hypothetical protein
VLVVLAQRVLDTFELAFAGVGRFAPLDDVVLAGALARDGLAGAAQRLLRVGLAAATL